MPSKWAGKWKGGRVAIGADGAPVYVLERMVARRRYAITLDVASETEALAELALFLRDPVAYERTAAKAKEEARKAAVERDQLLIDAELVGRFLKHLQQKERSPKYVEDTKRYLATWAAQLGERDLRQLELKDLERALDKMEGARQQRIAAIKSFFSFLRSEEGLLKTAEDATLDLKVPQSNPEKNTRKKGYSMEHVEKIFGAVEDPLVRDVILARAKTGMHGSELRRLAKGEGVLAKLDGKTAIAGTLTVKHKNRTVHTQSLDADTFAALARIIEAGRIPDDKQINQAIDAAAKTLRVKPIRLGELRHSYRTWARTHGTIVRLADAGLPLDAIADSVRHKDTRTTKRFCDGTEVPPLIVVPLDLRAPGSSRGSAGGARKASRAEAASST